MYLCYHHVKIVNRTIKFQLRAQQQRNLGGEQTNFIKCKFPYQSNILRYHERHYRLHLTRSRGAIWVTLYAGAFLLPLHALFHPPSPTTLGPSIIIPPTPRSRKHQTAPLIRSKFPTATY